MTPAEIRAARKRLGLSQAAFGAALARALSKARPIHFTTVSRWERGAVEPPAYLPLVLRQLEAERAAS